MDASTLTDIRYNTETEKNICKLLAARKKLVQTGHQTTHY